MLICWYFADRSVQIIGISKNLHHFVCVCVVGKNPIEDPQPEYEPHEWLPAWPGSRGVYSSRKSELFPRVKCCLPNPSPSSSCQILPQVLHQHQSYRCLLTMGIDPSLTCFVMIWWGVMGCAPLRSLKILYFWNWNHTLWWILLGPNFEQAKSGGKKKHSFMDLTDHNFAFWEKFW